VPGTIETVIGVLVRHYDGEGTFTQVNNEKGSVSGSGPADREGAGTYVVNEDCTGTHQLQLAGSTITVTDRFVIVDRGREVRSFVVSPAPVMVTGVSQKIGIR
jgi:carbon monoxide dehydrogenase subunit G